MKRCPHCSARNDDTVNVCSLCQKHMNPAAAESYEPRLWQQGKQRRRGETGSVDEAPREAPREAVREVPRGDRYYLVPPVGDPITLDAAKPVVFGRDQGCEIKIGSTKVSRRHAELRWETEASAWTLRDLSSQNGTYLNDNRIEAEVAVQDGDTIRLGDFVACYRFLPPDADESELRPQLNETTVMAHVDVIARASESSEVPVLEGDATILPIHEVLKKLTLLHAHGTLRLDVMGAKGRITIVDGRPIDGDYAGLEGNPAITAMAALTKGHFRFEPSASAPPLRAPAPAAPPAARPPRPSGERPVAVMPGTTPAGASGTTPVPRPAPRPPGPQGPTVAPRPAPRPPGAPGPGTGQPTDRMTRPGPPPGGPKPPPPRPEDARPPAGRPAPPRPPRPE